jgi:hypothetical protein
MRNKMTTSTMRTRRRSAASRPVPATPEPRRTAFALILVVAAMLAYGNSMRIPLVLDDQITVVENPQIRALWTTAIFTPERELPVAGRPLVNATFAVNYALDGINPRGYHAVNLLLHTLCAMLLFALVRRIFLLPSLAARFGVHATPMAFAAALIWWRFYTFYIYILLGALAAGRTVMRAVRKTEEYESEVELQHQ